MFRPHILAASVVILATICTGRSIAKGSDWNIKSGAGEELEIKHHLFGRKDTKVKDRLGDKFVHTEGLLGNSKTDVSVLGNRVTKKRGLFGSSDVEMSSILGDKVVSKKGWFGRRKTSVDLSGINNLINQYTGKRSSSQTSVPYGLSTPTNDLSSPNMESNFNKPFNNIPSDANSNSWTRNTPTLGDSLTPADK